MKPSKRMASCDTSNPTRKRRKTNPPVPQEIEQPSEDRAEFLLYHDRRHFKPIRKAATDKRLSCEASARSSPITSRKYLNFFSLTIMLFRLLRKCLSFLLNPPNDKPSIVKSLGLESICNSLDIVKCTSSYGIIEHNLTSKMKHNYGKKQIKELIAGNPDLKSVASDFIFKLMQRDTEFKKSLFMVTAWSESKSDGCMMRCLHYFMGVEVDSSGCEDQGRKSAHGRCNAINDSMDDSTQPTYENPVPTRSNQSQPRMPLSTNSDQHIDDSFGIPKIENSATSQIPPSAIHLVDEENSISSPATVAPREYSPGPRSPSLRECLSRTATNSSSEAIKKYFEELELNC